MCIDLESEVNENSFCVDKKLSLAEIKITLTNKEFEENLYLDEKTNGEYKNCLVEEIEEVIKEHKNETKFFNESLKIAENLSTYSSPKAIFIKTHFFLKTNENIINRGR